jgi:TfoX/Sxy family transcriptional regulator of competence genes
VSYDRGLAERVADVLTRMNVRGVRQKNVFGGRGFLTGKSAFVIVWDDGLIVKCPPSEYKAAVASPNVEPFAPDGEKPMSTWVVVAGDAIADDPELEEWLGRGMRAVR